jgi:beta-galactosidase/beta-glucuronidase
MQDRIPRPEYPRPQFVRREWLNLNGEWEFAFDDGNQGLQHAWQDGRRLDGRIVVPFTYQHPPSGINDKSVHEVVWYARSFSVPDEWRERDLLLHFGAVDYQCTVWVNGNEIGHNRGGHVPFRFDIAPYLKPGENRITLRVVDRQDPSQPRGKQSSTGQPHGIDYYCTTGIWQTVWLEPAPPIRIEDLRINPQYIEDAIHFLVYLHAPASDWTLIADALDGDTVVATVEQHTGAAAAGITIPIPGARKWSPDDPHLYGLRLRLLQNGRVLDEVESYAGLRRVELRNGRFLLNGEPRYLAMVLDQGYFPGGYLTAESDEALREDVKLIRRFGFNGARKHQKIEDPRWLYWCDRLGLLVWGEMPNARAWSSEAEERLSAEWERAVRRDYNHPCIVAWVPVNEGMGFPELKQEHPGQYAFLEQMVTLTRRLDPDRPVIDNDGWEHTDIGDILAVHDYSHSGEALRQHWSATMGGQCGSENLPLPARIWSGSRAILARGSEYRGQPIMLTEVGGLLYLPDVPPEELDRLYKVYASFKTADELLAKYRDIMEGIADLKFISGFCYTQLTDIEQEINGLLTFDRKPKLDPEVVAGIHRELFGV